MLLCAQYALQLYPPKVTGFVPAQDINHSLQEFPVEIATTYAEGPHPTQYSPVPKPLERRTKDRDRTCTNLDSP